MNTLHLTQRLRPLLWTLAALGLIAIVVWRVTAWSPASTNADGNGPDGSDRAKPGPVIYPADKRATAPTLEGATRLTAIPLPCPT